MYNPFFPVNSKSNTVIYLVLANIAIFAVQALVSGFTETFALTPSIALQGAYWQFFTYMFLHGGFYHIFINMFVLLVFGIPVESSLGRKKFLALYFISGLFSAVFYMLLTTESAVMMLGASGAIFAVLTAYGFLFPDSIILVGFILPVKAKFAVILFAVIEFFSGAMDLQMGVANFGHLGGIIAGVLIMLYWRHSRRRRKSPEFRDLEFFWE